MNDVSKKVRKTVEKLVENSLSQYGATACQYQAAPDSLGEEVIYITLCYAENSMPVSVAALTRLTIATIGEFQKIGETRFPSYLHIFNKDLTFEAA